jgi:uncharacterized membrane protein YqiK
MAALAVFALFTIGLILTRLYQRASKEVSFVRTGLGGQKVIMNGGALVFPVLHEVIPVNMNTLRLNVLRENEAALITRDRMRVDVQAEFYVRVQPTAEAIADAAQTLGQRTMYPDRLKDLVEGKFVNALRAVAAEMTMEELQEQRVDFVRKVQTAVSEDLLKNGLELESVSLTSLDQTDKEYFNPNNAFDAAGLTKLTEEIEAKRRRRNEIEQDTQVLISTKNLEAEKKQLDISRDVEYAKLQQEREIAVRKAGQNAEIAREQAEKEREAEEARILAAQQVQSAKIAADREVEQQRIEKERLIREKDIEREKVNETADIERRKTVELSEQDRAIAVAEKSRAQSIATAEANKALADAVASEERVTTAKETEIAERAKAVQLIEARKLAEQDAIKLTVAAEAQKVAAVNEADAIRTLAEASAQKSRIEAQGSADAEILHANAAERRYAVEAEGRKLLNEADNVLSGEIVALRQKLAIIENLQNIIRESVKPLENIDGIKIIQVDGLTGGRGSAAAVNGGGGGDGKGETKAGLADQIVSSALAYRSQAPLIDSLMKEVGLTGGDLDSLTEPLRPHLVKTNGAGDGKEGA